MAHRIVFNMIALTTLGFILNPHQKFINATRKSSQKPPRAIELRNARALPGKTPSISIDFVMKNNTRRMMTLVERWNSWGAYQWAYELTDATGKKFSLENPQDNWKRNYLSFFTINPDSEFLLSGFLDFIGVRKWDENGFVYKRGVDKLRSEKIKPWRYPVKIVGKFTAKIEAYKIFHDGVEDLAVHPGRSNWEGTITTAPITVKAPTRL